MGSRKGVLGRGRDRVSVAPQSGSGDPRERRAAAWGGGVSFPSHPSVFSHSHFPNSPVLPGCHGNCSCQARSPRKPRARLSPPPHHWSAPPPQAAVVWKVGGAMGGRTRTPDPERGPKPTSSEPPPPRKPPSSAPQLDTQRLPDVLPPIPRRRRPPQHRTKNLHPTASPTGFCSPAGPAHCPLPPPHPGGGLRPRSPN